MRYYLDTEFDGYRGPLLSLALVREDGDSCSLWFRDEATDPWVREHVIPVLWSQPSLTRAGRGSLSTAEQGAAFVAWFLAEDPDPVIIADWPADIRYFCELIEYPGGRMAELAVTAPLTFELHRVDAYPTDLPGAVQHNAWWDAMALRYLLQNVS